MVIGYIKSLFPSYAEAAGISAEAELLMSKSSCSAEDFWPKLYTAKPFTLVGDTNHTDPRLLFFFMSGRNIDVMANSGVKNVFLEGSQSKDSLLRDREYLSNIPSPPDEYDYEGRPQEIIKILKNNAYLAFCGECHRRGIEVHFCDDADVKLDPKLISATEAFYAEFKKGHSQKYGADKGITKEFMMAYGKSNMFWHPFKWQKYINAVNEVSRLRQDDTDVVESIKVNASQAGNVIFWGAGHFDDGAQSMATLLGADNYAHVNLMGAPEAFIDCKPKSNADFTFFTETGAVHHMSRRSKTMLGAASVPSVETDLRL